jgi:hypothetical protein
LAEDRLRKAEFRALRDRLTVLGVALLSILIDLAFLVVWLAVLQLARAMFDQLSGHSRSAAIVYQILEVVSIGSTLVVVVAYVVRDVMLSVQRIWKLMR